jgi:RecA-family ATPase
MSTFEDILNDPAYKVAPAPKSKPERKLRSVPKSEPVVTPGGADAIDAAEAHAEETKRQAKRLTGWVLPDNIMQMVVPPQAYAIAPYLPVGCATGLSGQGKVGKGFLTLAMMLCVAAGRPFFGHPVTQGDVWYFSAEDSPDRVMERAQSILKDFTPEERARAVKHFHAFDAVGKGLFFVATMSGAAVITDVCVRISEMVGKAVFVVVDTVSRINPLPENSNEGMALVVAAAEVIARRTGACVLLNHHVGKSQARSGEVDMYSGRGASSFGDNCRSVLTLSHATDEQVKCFDEATQEQQRDNNVRVLTHSAASYGREAPTMYLLRRENGTFAKLDPVTDLVTPLAEWLRTKGLVTFSRYTLTQTHAKNIWAPAPSRSAINKFIDASIRDGILVEAVGGQGGGKQYRLSSATPEHIADLDAGVREVVEGSWLDIQE